MRHTKQRNHVRASFSYKAMSDMIIKKSLVKIKEHPPYVGDMEGKVLLNSMARATFDPGTGEYSFHCRTSSSGCCQCQSLFEFCCYQ
jgi:fatty acid synthase subunit alpha, fungi type